MIERTPHKLFSLLIASNPADEDVADLYQDLKYIFETDFDSAIQEAVTVRGCTYLEMPAQLPN